MTRAKQLGLIGFGQFGQFCARHLRDRFEVLVSDCRPVEPAARSLGIRCVSIVEAASAPVVVLAVPVQALRDVLDAIAPYLVPGALVVDVCSVKVHPQRWMAERLPAHVEILGSHPMFGPQSAADGLAGHTIVLCPQRTERVAAAASLLESLGLRVIVSDPDTHDRQAAYTQALAQFVGRAIRDIEGADFAIGTRAASLLRQAARMVADDSDELFAAIQDFNPHAREMRDEVRRRLAQIDGELGDDPDGAR